MARDNAVRPDPQLEHLPTGPAKQCKDILFLDFGPIRASFECEIPELPNEHPGQPHMVRIPPLEPGDEIFLGWWHAEPPPPATKPNIIFTRTPEDDDGY